MSSRRSRGSGLASRDPFAVLGLAAANGLSDDEVRAAWRRVASATHPDRADGGDPGRYAAASAAYTELRTEFGRGEALAHLRGSQEPCHVLARLPSRIARGRPVRLALRLVGATAVAWAALASGAPRGAGPAVAAGAVTWLVLSGRADLAP